MSLICIYCDLRVYESFICIYSHSQNSHSGKMTIWWHLYQVTWCLPFLAQKNIQGKVAKDVASTGSFLYRYTLYIYTYTLTFMPSLLLRKILQALTPSFSKASRFLFPSRRAFSTIVTSGTGANVPKQRWWDANFLGFTRRFRGSSKPFVGWRLRSFQIGLDT